MLEWAVIALISAGLGVLALFAFLQFRIYSLEYEAKLFIEDYRAKLNGSNRFLFDENLMRTSFPEYSDYVVHRVWGRLVANKAIERDSMDGMWCIK